MPSPAAILLIATLLPLVGFCVLLAMGKRLGAPLAGWVGTAFVAGSFLCSLLVLFQWYSNDGSAGARWGWKRSAITLSTAWIPVGESTSAASPPADHPGWLDAGIYIDSLTIAMFLMVTLVALIVHIFSIGYMRGDRKFGRFFTYMALFSFAMFGLLLSSTLIQLFMFWEGVGLCSYLLIGFWSERRLARRAALKAFIVNRVGDCAFLIGFGLLFLHVGNVSLPHLWAILGTAGQGGDVHLGGGTAVSAAMMTLIGICLFFGAAGKSAQFPLHVWLPDAMEGPSPVSALIHAATMVAAGVYLVARLFPILTPDAKLLIAIVGCVTLLLGALIALVQTDIKRILAYSTISQLGYMMLAIGAGSWVGGLFHLIAHAFFKALLFLAAGSVIYAAHHRQEMSQYGGLWKRIPVTAFCFAIAVLAISGAGVGGWGLSGYYSKSNMLIDAGGFAIWATDHGLSSAYWLLFVIPAIVGYLTPLYMTRLWMLTFWGKPRNERVYKHARETPMMYVPLMALAVMSGLAGYKLLSVQDLLSGALVESQAAVNRVIADSADVAPGSPHTLTAPAVWAAAWPAIAPTARAPLPGEEAPEVSALDESQRVRLQAEELETTWMHWAWPIGMLMGIGLYFNGFSVARRLVRLQPIGWIHTWLLNKMYFDELYEAIFLGTMRFASRIAGWFDRMVVDGMVNLIAASTRSISRIIGWGDARLIDGAVSGVGQVAWSLGVATRSPQTGRVRAYVTALMFVVVIGLAVTVGVMMWN